MKSSFLKTQWAFVASFAMAFAVFSACSNGDNSSSAENDDIAEIESSSDGDSSDSEESPSSASSSSKKKNKSSSSISKESSSSEEDDDDSSSSKAQSSSSKVKSSSSKKVGSSSSAVEESSSSFWRPDIADMNPVTCKTEGLVLYALDDNNERITRVCKKGKWVIVESSSSSVVPRSSGSTPSICEVEHYNMDRLFNPDVDYGELKDSRDGKVYKTVEISKGGMSFVVFAQNLNYGVQIVGLDSVFNDSKVEKYCLEDDPWYCENGFGGLYSWSEAMGLPKACDSVVTGTTADCPENLAEGAKSDEDWATLQIQGICPDGWHILNEKEWTVIAGNNKYVGDLISRVFANEDDLGFSALPAGMLNVPGGIEYELAPEYGFMWLPQEFNTKYAHAIAFTTSIWEKNLESIRKSSGLSVRCVKNYKVN